MTAFQTRGHVDLRVALAAGEVRVESVDTPGVDVQLVPLRDNDATRQAIAEARVEMTDRGGDHVVVVQIPKRSGLLWVATRRSGCTCAARAAATSTFAPARRPSR